MPERTHIFGLYINGKWYSLSAREGTYDDKDPVGCIDAEIFAKQILGPILGIQDAAKFDRVEFVGGTKGLKELERKVDSGEMSAAFSFFPVSMSQLLSLADTGGIMPPKTTWFEPKLRSGLVIHSFD